MAAKISKMTILLALAFSVFITGCDSPHGGPTPVDMALLEISGRTLSAIGAVAGAPWYLSRSISAMGDPVMEIHGKVVDYHGNPVEGVKLLGYFDHGNRHGLDLITGANGKFVFKRQATEVSIAQVEKDGYEFIRKISRPITFFKYPADGEKSDKKYFSNADNPVLVHIRKLGPINYVVKWDKGLSYKNVSRSHDIQFAASWFDSYGFFHEPRKTAHVCLKVRTETNKISGKCNMLFEYSGTEGGVLLDDNTLHIAPKEGYKPSVQLENFNAGYKNNPKLKGEKKNNDTLYVRCGDCNLYSRITLINYNEYLSCNLNIYTSPEGIRHLDYHERQWYKIRNERMGLHKKFDAIYKKASKKHWNKQRSKPVAKRVRFDVAGLKEEFIRKIRKEQDRKQN